MRHKLVYQSVREFVTDSSTPSGGGGKTIKSSFFIFLAVTVRSFFIPHTPTIIILRDPFSPCNIVCTVRNANCHVLYVCNCMFVQVMRKNT